MKINKIIHSYSSFTLDVENLFLKDYSIIGLIGENGAGKTTLMNILSGMLIANEVMDFEDYDFNNTLFIPSDLEPYSYMTVIEFVNIILKYSKSNLSSDTILKKLELEEKKNVLIEDLSQGMKKKLTLINLFVNEYRLIILDEPFNSVDIKYIYQIKTLLADLKKKSTIIISSHILDTLNDICDEFWYLEKGKIKKVFNNDKNIDTLERELFE